MQCSCLPCTHTSLLVEYLQGDAPEKEGKMQGVRVVLKECQCSKWREQCHEGS